MKNYREEFFRGNLITVENEDDDDDVRQVIFINLMHLLHVKIFNAIKRILINKFRLSLNSGRTRGGKLSLF